MVARKETVTAAGLGEGREDDALDAFELEELAAGGGGEKDFGGSAGFWAGPADDLAGFLVRTGLGELGAMTKGEGIDRC